MMKSNFLLLSLISLQSSLAFAFSLVHTRKAAFDTQRISYKLKSKLHSYREPNYIQDSFRLLMTAEDDDGWGDDAKLPTSSQEDELESLRAQVSSKTKNNKQIPIQGGENTERDLFIPIFAIVSLVGLFGAYGYEMLRLYSRGELYLPWN